MRISTHGTYLRTFHKLMERMVDRHTGPNSRTAFWDSESGKMVAGYKSTAYTREGLALRRLTRLVNDTCNRSRR